MTLTLIAKQANQFGVDDRRQFEELVLSGGQVMANGLSARIASAHYLAFLTLGGELVGINAVKNNRPHQRTVEKASGVELLDDEFLGEIGWLHVAEGHRGKNLGGLLMSAILSCTTGHRLFSTVQSKNIGARLLHERHGFHKVGKPWASDQQGDLVELYIHTGRRA